METRSQTKAFLFNSLLTELIMLLIIRALLMEKIRIKIKSSINKFAFTKRLGTKYLQIKQNTKNVTFEKFMTNRFIETK